MVWLGSFSVFSDHLEGTELQNSTKEVVLSLLPLLPVEVIPNPNNIA